ncbi:ABC transporter permease [Pyrobaculum aerophilum]|uniref:ABC transporter permease n=2 Tax=Pyrobaculum aerophilum TaxID=13773 RepID=UPI002162C404|nr:ABC transporter permease [Pyrobaculum aerophilum]
MSCLIPSAIIKIAIILGCTAMFKLTVALKAVAAFTAIVLKDLREVLTSRFFIASLAGGLVTLIALGAVFGTALQFEQGGTQKFAVVVNGTTELGEKYVEILKRLGGDVYGNFTERLLDAYSFVVVVPRNFSLPATVEVYARYRRLFSLAPPPVLDAASAKLASEMGLPPRLVDAVLIAYIDGRRLTASDVSSIMGMFMFSWIFMFIVPLLLASTAAITVGMEKEKRTFELILSTPATAPGLIAAKLLSTLILALIQFAVLSIGLAIYMLNVSKAVPHTTAPGQATIIVSSSVTPSVAASVVISTLALSIFLLAIAFLIATKAEDIKSAQNIAALVILPLLLPSIVAIFGTVQGLEAYPFIHPLASAFAALLGQWDKVFLYLLTDWALAVAALILVFKIVTAEFLITGKLRK